MTDIFTGTLESDVGNLGQQVFQTSYVVPQVQVDTGYTLAPSQSIGATGVTQAMAIGTIGTTTTAVTKSGDNKLLIILGIALLAGLIAVM